MTRVSSPSSSPIILLFDVFIVSPISWTLCARRSEDLQLAYLIPWLCIPRGCLLELESRSWRGKRIGGDDLCDPLESGVKGEGKMHEVVCCRARDETGELDLEKRNSR